MLETVKLVFTQFNDETLIISFLILGIVGFSLMAIWTYNRKKYHQLGHQIPASVVKSYLDSIIQNSTALKSSLFRGGGLELGDGIPSVMPVAKLSPGPMPTSEISSELLGQKNAEIAALQGKVMEKDRIIRDLEAQINQLQSHADKKDSSGELSGLRDQLRASQTKTTETASQLQSVTKERDDLLGRLQEYEIIEDDLANLKKLQSENEELKKKLGGMGGSSPSSSAPAAAAAAAAAVAVAAAPPAMESPAEPENFDLDGQANGAEDIGQVEAGDVGGGAEGEEKSAEDLLSEFEKMLE